MGGLGCEAAHICIFGMAGIKLLHKADANAAKRIPTGA